MRMATLRLAGGSPWLSPAIAVAGVAALYAPVVASMADEWARFPNLSHGFAIPLIAAYLVWARWDRLAQIPVGSSPLGLPLAVLGLAMLVMGSLVGEPFLARVSLPVTLVGTLLFLAGAPATRQLWIGVAYLVFMIPLPYVTLRDVTYQSRLFDAAVTAEALRWLGVPVLREGVMLHLANMTLEVADECSSIPAVAALVALGAAYAQINPRPTWVRVLLVLAAAPLGLASNIVRLVLTSLGAYYLGRIALENVIHKFNGTSVFLLTVVLLIVLDGALMSLWRRRRRS
ncbi:MAG: exosortase/archaeosortase family protein [Candidatus Rokubacteria bacterium]|nr:exosortase/archaeosortase family protein [Candidatus Rokubacteria bacterium]